MIAPSGLGGIIGWASIVVVLGAGAAVGQTVWLRRAARPGLATAEEAAAHKHGVAAADDATAHRPPSRIDRRDRRR